MTGRHDRYMKQHSLVFVLCCLYGCCSTLPKLRSLAGVHYHGGGSGRGRRMLLATECKQCPAGFFSSAEVNGRLQCIHCVPGTFQWQNASSACLPCQKGFYSSQPAATLCTKCQAGTYAANMQMDACKPCEPGFFVARESSDRCFPCAR